MKKKLIIGLAVTLLAGGGASAYYFTALGGAASEDELADAVVEEPVEIERDALFHNLPPLVVSSTYNGSLRYLQVKLSILTRDEEILAKLQANTPLIQNSLIMLLDSYEFSELDNTEGKEMLRAKAEEEVRGIIKDEGVESVLFTGFVIQ